jgi:hypothetical protein
MDGFRVKVADAGMASVVSRVKGNEMDGFFGPFSFSRSFSFPFRSFSRSFSFPFRSFSLPFSSRFFSFSRLSPLDALLLVA